MFERITAKVLKLGNGLFSGGDTQLEFDIGDGAGNPKIRVIDSTDTIECTSGFNVAENFIVEGNANVTGDLDVIGELSIDGDPVLTFVPDASTTQTGSVNQTAQTFAGRKNGNGWLPSGVVLPFAGFTLPSFFYWCDGAVYLISAEPDMYASLTLAKSMTTVNGSTTITVSSTADLRVGYAVSGAGIPLGTKINSIPNATTFVISAAATAGAAITGRILPYDQAVNPTTGAAYAAPAAGYFRVPDTRSVYIRGVGTNNLGVQSSLGVWQDDATAKNGLLASHTGSTLTGSTVAANTNNTDLTHTHETANQAGSTSGGNIGLGSAKLDFGGTSRTSGTPSISMNHSHPIPSLSVNVTLPAQSITVGLGDAETRPQSIAMNHIIKS